MRLYLVHHGEAVPPSVDPQRPLSDTSRTTVEQLAERAAQKGATPAVVWHSGKLRACRSRIRHQAAAGSWTMPRQWEIQRTWLNSARAAVRSPAKPNGV